MKDLLSSSLMTSLVALQGKLADVEQNYYDVTPNPGKCPSCSYGCADACGKKCAGGCAHPTH
jgi:hypothetical protein